jgi:hypothetical protein
MNYNRIIDNSFFERINDLDTFDLQGRMGLTDYIDFLTKNEVPRNVMKGIDRYRRRFIIIKIGGFDLDTNKFFRTGQVFFERYTNEPNIMGANFEGMFIWTQGGTNYHQYKLINDLVDEKLVKLKEEHHFNSGSFNCLVANMNYWTKLPTKLLKRDLNINIISLILNSLI